VKPAADSPVRQQQAHSIPLLSRHLNELDSSFQLPEGLYTFEHELRAKEIMEAAYAEYIKSSGTSPDQHQAIIPTSGATPLPCTTGSGAVQDGSALGDTDAGLGDAVIDITLPVDTERPNGGEVDDSEAVVGKEQSGIP
jgi:hypothetical protein